MNSPGILTRDGGATIAYHRQTGSSPGIVFLGGFRSDMTGTKGMFLEEFCRRCGHAYVRFDYFGHGASSGDAAFGTIGHWTADTIAVIDSLTEGPQILVGSSMGGWIMLLAALARPSRIRGLVGIAAAPDFTEDLVWPQLDAAQRRQLRETGAVTMPSEYDPPVTPIASAYSRRASGISSCAGRSRSNARCGCCTACAMWRCPGRRALPSPSASAAATLP
jgi:pimeloyl-ACP methyl ester carboxylesterase